MTYADIVATLAIILSILALIWQYRTQVNDRKGKIKVDVKAENDPNFVTTIPYSTPSGRPIYNKLTKKFIITITNVGRETRVLKSYGIQVLDGDKDLKNYEYNSKTIEMGGIITEVFNPEEEVKKGTIFKVIVEDSMGEKYESKGFDIKELAI